MSELRYYAAEECAGRDGYPPLALEDRQLQLQLGDGAAA